MEKGSSKVAPESTTESSDEELKLRQSRLQVSGYGFDEWSLDDDSQSQDQKIYDSHFKRGEEETIRKGE